jgi:hypothetical protein
MIARRHLAGNTLPETALSLSIVMLVFFGAIQYALTGYEQAESDGAAFVAAHAASLDPNNAVQASRGASHARGVFPHLPVANVVVTPGQPGIGPNLAGEVVGSASRFTSALFALRSHVIEPVIGTYPGANSLTLSVSNSTLKNCLTSNPATPSCGAIYLAQLDSANKWNPYDQFDCHLQAYAALANGTAGSGTTVGSTPWPQTYKPGTSGSINDPAVRQNGIYLTNSGKLGSALKPIYDWRSNKPC